MKNKYPTIIIFYVLIFFTSCEKIDIGESFICRVDDKIRITNSLSFSVLNVNDWRCPIDVICACGGDVDVSLRFHQPFHRTDTVICLYSKGRNPIEFSGYTFELLAVDPLPETDIITPQKDFRITMMIRKH